MSDKKIAVASTTDPNLIAYYNADVVTANDYYPFGMTMPGRDFTLTGKKSRHSINGQERSDELNDNLTTAKYWEYDSRIGRRWNVDPIVKAYESPYAVFGNNPIWNIDPDGSDTAKYLSNGQLRDAMKIASNRVKDVLKSGAKFHSKQNDKALSNETDAYLDKNKLNFGASAEFNTSVQQYYEGLSHLAWWSGEKEFSKADRILNNAGVNDGWALRLIIANIKDAFGGAMSIITTTANFAVSEGAGALFVKVGVPPKGVLPARIPYIQTPGTLVEYGGGMSYIYRGENGTLPLFTLKGGEYKFTSQGVRGMSVNVDAPMLSNTRGAAYQITDMPAGLRIVQQGKNAGHFEIIPTSQISQDEFQTLLNKIQYTKAK